MKSLFLPKKKKKIKPFDPTNNNQCTNYESFKKINTIQDFFSPTKLNLLSQLTSHTTSYQKKKSLIRLFLKKKKKEKENISYDFAPMKN